MVALASDTLLGLGEGDNLDRFLGGTSGDLLPGKELLVATGNGVVVIVDDNELLDAPGLTALLDFTIFVSEFTDVTFKTDFGAFNSEELSLFIALIFTVGLGVWGVSGDTSLIWCCLGMDWVRIVDLKCCEDLVRAAGGGLLVIPTGTETRFKYNYIYI